MVFFKRKPVQYLPPPIVGEDQEVWIIDETDEIFTSYEQYLSRIDYYKQKRFICEITGHSGLDFFTALLNENQASNEVDESFPDPLREPVLRKVQHSTISRVDALVDWVYDEFKSDFYPGETVLVVLDGYDKMPGVVREKARFREQRDSDGKIQKPGAVRYFVSLIGQPDREAIVDDQHVVRDRKALTKMMLRSFIKNSVYREAWTGAPWQLKDKLAQQYNISTQIPIHLRYEHQVAQRKIQLGIKKGELTNGSVQDYLQKGLPELKPKGKGKSQDVLKLRQAQFEEYQKALSRNPAFQGSAKALTPDDPRFLQFISQHPELSSLGPKQVASRLATAPLIKYPREDLDNEVTDLTRPALKFLSTTSHENHEMNGDTVPIEEQSVGRLLETWNTLNVYCEVFVLDSFTFDDFVDALQPTADGIPSELLSEIHCAVLKVMVDEEGDEDDSVNIRMPDEEDSEEEDEEDEDSEREDGSEAEPEIVQRSTRSSLAKTQAAELKAQAALDAKVHHGPEVDQCVKNYGWKQRLRKRDLANGRWVVAVVGLLNAFTLDPRRQALCDDLLTQLAPLDAKPTEDAVIWQYAELDINTRVRILEFLCLLTVDTPAIRNYMEECMLQMTDIRKTRMDHVRNRKQYLEDLRALDEERQALQPEAKSPIAEIEEIQEKIEEAEIKDPDEDGDITMEDDDDIPQRSLRRAQDRAAERKKKKEEARKRKEKAEFDKANKPTKEARKLEKLLKQIDGIKEKIKDEEAEIATCDNELRENDCHRTRVLGKDRFWNRYYWYERNAMPYGGLPDSSTAEAGYANGRVWVQGPDEMERLGFIDMAENEVEKYRKVHKMSPAERKLKEEGDTHVMTARQWGYLDTPEELERLVEWLTDKGIRETKLKKELLSQREHIVEGMQKRVQYLEGAIKPEPSEPVTRISTRTKTYVDPSGRRFMRWRNSTALRENGHLHSEPLKPKRGVARVVSSSRKARDDGEPRPRGRPPGRPPGRQGSRYNF